MGRVISFEERAVARLRDRLGKAETARADLLAFARGHSGTVAAIHQAVLAALDADSHDELLRIVTVDWPEILGVDSVVLALVVGDKAFRADRLGVQLIARPIVNRAMQSLETPHGADLLLFLGQSLAAMNRIWAMTEPNHL